MKYVNENGRSMVEMLGVLAIIGVLSVGGIAGYSKAMNKFKINKTTDQVTMLVANIRTMFSSQGNYDGLTQVTAAQYGLVPNDMLGEYTAATSQLAENQALKNAFAGDVIIQAVPARSTTTNLGGTAAKEAFIVSYSGLTEEACAAMLTGDWGSGQASGLISVAGGAASGDNAAETMAGNANKVFTDTADSSNADIKAEDNLVIAAPGGKVNVPVTVAQAVAACSGGNSGNAVAWKYY